MTKIDIFSGFLGAGKTTLIKKLIKEAYEGEKLVLIENEFGDIGIDGGFMKDAGIEVTEMNSGCICCSLVGDFGEALKKVIAEYAPERILIEPSGVGKLSDVIKAVENIHSDDIILNSFTTVVDAKKCKVYLKNFGEFFLNQIESAGTVILSHTAGLSEEKTEDALKIIKEHNPDATVITTDWDEISGKLILDTMEQKNSLKIALEKLHDESDICPECGHHHHHDHDECCHGEHEHHHHDHDECCHDEHEHHHHDHDECCHGEHEHHHHDHGECCHGEHEHHHHHHADEVFTSFGTETSKKYSKEELTEILSALSDEQRFGNILRAKGIVASDGKWLHFDYVPGEPDVREGSADVIGRLCVIGAKINEEEIGKLFGLDF